MLVHFEGEINIKKKINM